MSGHSKWANIKHRKEAQDVKRSKNFQKLAKEILVAIKEKGNDPDKNTRLKLAIEKAKSQNMPSDNITKLLQKNQKDTSNWHNLMYEGFGPGGVAIIVECLSDNINRTAAQVKAAFTKFGGNLGTNGSVSYMFERLGVVVLDKEIYDFNALIELLLETDILDLEDDDEAIVIKTTPQKLLKTKEFLLKNNIDKFIAIEVMEYPKDKISVDEEKYEKIERLVNILENLEDVQNVYTNLK